MWLPCATSESAQLFHGVHGDEARYCRLICCPWLRFASTLNLEPTAPVPDQQPEPEKLNQQPPSRKQPRPPLNAESLNQATAPPFKTQGTETSSRTSWTSKRKHPSPSTGNTESPFQLQNPTVNQVSQKRYNPNQKNPKPENPNPKSQLKPESRNRDGEGDADFDNPIELAASGLESSKLASLGSCSKVAGNLKGRKLTSATLQPTCILYPHHAKPSPLISRGAARPQRHEHTSQDRWRRRHLNLR